MARAKQHCESDSPNRRWRNSFFVTSGDNYIPPNAALSDMDKAYMALVYPRTTPDSSAPQWTTDYAFPAEVLSGSNVTNWNATCTIDFTQAEVTVSVSTESNIGGTLITASTTSAHQAISAKLGLLWDCEETKVEHYQTVSYSFINGTADQQAKVNKIALEWWLLAFLLPSANVNFNQVPSSGTIQINFADNWQPDASGVGTANKTALAFSSPATS
ncbi:hypothetical protein K438DRAFT_1925354, partial [Mycena galopus ATCC 62051]